jgi:hypothetical protein
MHAPMVGEAQSGCKQARVVAISAIEVEVESAKV